jgi:hypothetical protein
VVDVQCTLDAGGDTDLSEAVVGLAAGASVAQTVANSVTHTFSAPGSASLRCLTGGGVALVGSIKITAIKVGSESHTPV